MRALIIEDDVDQSERVAKRLTREGYECDRTHDGATGCEKLSSGAYTLAIVDLMLPKISGFEIIRQAREKGVKTPVIILSAKDERTDRISGLNFGADYYLTKPYSGDELIAAVNAVFRRLTPEGSNAKLVFEDIELDPGSGRVTRDGHEIILTPYEFKLLKHLMQNPGLLVSSETIIRRVWRYACSPANNIVSPRVYTLRRNLNQFGGRDVVQCVRGVGYVLR